jgi:hypothetical protein
MAILDTKHKKKASLFTIIILIVFVWGIFSFGMQYQDPPIEYGIAINFGTSDEGRKKPKNIASKLPVQENQEKKSEETVEDIPEEIKNDEVLSQADKDTPTIEKPKEDAEPTPKKPSKNTLKAFDDLLKGDTSDGKPKGDGDAIQQGVKGSENGNPASTKYYGNTNKSGDPNYNLAGREAQLTPQKRPDCQIEGKVVVEVYVDRNGKVIRANPGVKGSTVTQPCLLKPAREAALSTTWNADPNAPKAQKGTIIYIFSLKK